MISVNDFDPNASGSSKVSKILRPGTHYCRIADISVSSPPYNPNALNITLVLVGPELEDFEGMAVDKMNPGLGTYEGQAGFVQASRYAFADYTPPSGKTLTLDFQVNRFLLTLANELGVYEDIKASAVSGETIEEYIANMKSFLCSDKRIYFTIGGIERPNEYGMNYNLFLVKNEKNSKGVYVQPYAGLEDGKSLEDLDMNLEDLKDRMVLFNEAKHIEGEPKVKAVDESKDMSSGTSSSASTVTLTKNPFSL